MNYLYCSLIGYLIGSINPSFFLGKTRGVDIRSKGSGNAGASNVIILFGKMLGAFCATFDVLKAFFAVLLASALFPDTAHSFAITGAFCIIGHVFPFYMRFRGGKGLACLGGIVLAFDLRVFAVMLTLAVIVAFVTDYICFVPITASAAFPVVYGIITRDVTGALMLSVTAVIMFYKHIENLKRIRNGTEMHFSYLWNKDAELERIQKSANANDETMEERFSCH